MTDAQHQAREAIEPKLSKYHARIVQLIETFPGSTIGDIMRRHKTVFNIPLEKNAAGGRLSELADAGVVYVNGRKGGQSRYYYEPDPSCRFQIRQAREDEAFLRWARRGLKDYFERIPAHVRPWLESLNKM